MRRSSGPHVKYVAVLAAIATAILVAGAMLRPPAAEQSPPSEMDLARLTRLTERRALESSSAYLAWLADEVAPTVVRVGNSGISGVAIAADRIVTARLAAPMPATLGVTTSGGEPRLATVVWSPDLPAAGLTVSGPADLRPASPSAVPARAGDPLVALWRADAGRVYAAATFLDEAATRCAGAANREVRTTLVLTPAMAGGGLFDLDGRLLGVILSCGDRYAAVIPEVIDGMLRTAASLDGRLLARYGMTVGAMSAVEADLFQAPSGAVVREIRIGTPADASGLRPGDVIVALDGMPVAQPDDLRPLASTPAPARFVVTVRHATAEVDVTVGAAAAPATHGDADSSGVEWAPAAPGVVIDQVRPGSRAAAAGLKAGDRVVRVGEVEPRSPAQLRRLLDPSAPVLLEVARGDRRVGVILTQVAP